MATRETRRPGLRLGIDLGGTKVLAGVVDDGCRVLGTGKLKTPFAGTAADLGAALVAAADAALAGTGRGREEVSAVGVAAPGVVDARKGLLLRANNLAVRSFSFPKALAKAFPGAGVFVENDVRLAALAEARLGAGRGARSIVAVWVGTGIGGAVLLDGELRTGRNRNAGEIGQMLVDRRDARPGEPDGTLESVASKTAIARFVARRVERGEASVLAKAVTRKDARLSGKELAAALAGGDGLAQKAVERSAKAVGMAMASVFALLSPDLFVLGGGVAEALGAPYVEEVRKWAKAFAFSTELGGIEVVPAALGDRAGLLGAALLASG